MIQRYRVDAAKGQCCLKPFAQGDCVLHHDHLAAMAAKDAHAAVLQRLAHHLREQCHEYNTALGDEQDRNSELSEKLVKAEQEAAGLRAAIDEALMYGGNRWSEWGERAEFVEAVLTAARAGGGQ